MSNADTAKLPPPPPATMAIKVANRLTALANAVREGRVDPERAALIVQLIGGDS